MRDINKLKRIFLDDTLDEDEYQDNLKQITEWEESIQKNEAYLSWQEHDITKEIIKKAKEIKRSNADKLSTDRTLTNEQRNGIFNKQDTLDWLISLATRDAKGQIRQVKANIKEAINATNKGQ